MLYFLALAQAVQLLYQVQEEIFEEDFQELPTEYYSKLPVEYTQNRENKEKFYTLSREKTALINETNTYFISSESEKEDILNAVSFINKEANKSSKTFSSFKEKLLYMKSKLPDIITSPEKTV